MTKPNLAKISALVAALGLIALVFATPFTLKRQPKTGDTIKYRFAMIFNVNGVDVTYTSLLTDRVTSVDPSGNYTVQTTQTEFKATLGDQDAPMKSTDVQPTYTTYSPSGAILQIRGQQPENAYRVANLGAVHLPDKPVNIGDTWSASVQPDASTGTVALAATYNVIGPQEIGPYGAVAVKLSYKEATASNPAMSDGTVWINPADGTVVKMDVDWKNAPVLGLTTHVNAHLNYTREP